MDKAWWHIPLIAALGAWGHRQADLSVSSTPAWMYIVPFQSELHNETISRRKQGERKEKWNIKRAKGVVQW